MREKQNKRILFNYSFTGQNRAAEGTGYTPAHIKFQKGVLKLHLKTAKDLAETIIEKAQTPTQNITDFHR